MIRTDAVLWVFILLKSVLMTKRNVLQKTYVPKLTTESRSFTIQRSTRPNTAKLSSNSQAVAPANMKRRKSNKNQRNETKIKPVSFWY